jgi:hypothetical protein
MIKFSLSCDRGHEFESWFPDGASFDEQARRGFVTCPHCNSAHVSKAPMAPAIVSRERPLIDEKAKAIREAMVALRREIEKRTDDVGEAFPQVARAIHAGEAPERAIRGQANIGEVKALLEEGVPVAPVPLLPDEAN